MADQFDTIRVHKHVKKAFDKLCEKHDRGKSEMVQQMVEYFQISGIDPLQVSVATKGRTYSQLRKEIGTMIQKAVEDRFIGIEDKMDLLIRNTMGKEKENGLFDMVESYSDKESELTARKEKPDRPLTNSSRTDKAIDSDTWLIPD